VRDEEQERIRLALRPKRLGVREMARLPPGVRDAERGGPRPVGLAQVADEADADRAAQLGAPLLERLYGGEDRLERAAADERTGMDEREALVPPVLEGGEVVEVGEPPASASASRAVSSSP